MAYLAFNEAGAAACAGSAPARIDIGLSALEWSVVAIARQDKLATLRSPGRIERAFAALFSNWRNPRLTDPQLEALRRIAVLSWHRGYSVAPHEVRDFYAAGYSPNQYELIVNNISATRAAQYLTDRRA